MLRMSEVKWHVRSTSTAVTTRKAPSLQLRPPPVPPDLFASQPEEPLRLPGRHQSSLSRGHDRRDF
jgi:hypothetical protein